MYAEMPGYKMPDWKASGVWINPEEQPKNRIQQLQEDISTQIAKTTDRMIIDALIANGIPAPIHVESLRGRLARMPGDPDCNAVHTRYFLDQRLILESWTKLIYPTGTVRVEQSFKIHTWPTQPLTFAASS